MKNEPLFRRMGYAFSGLRCAFLREKSLRFHFYSTVAVIFVLVVFRPPVLWWGLVFLAICVVITAELFNTAIEELCDYVQPENDERIKYIKDVAAGAVLVASVGAFIVGCALLRELLLGRL